MIIVTMLDWMLNFQKSPNFQVREAGGMLGQMDDLFIFVGGFVKKKDSSDIGR